MERGRHVLLFSSCFHCAFFGSPQKGRTQAFPRWHKRATEGLRGRIMPERCCRCQDKALEQTKQDDARVPKPCLSFSSTFFGGRGGGVLF